jgi:hypothetical protein
MRLVLKSLKDMSCVELEEQFGLKRGDIQQKVVHADGTIEIRTPLQLTTDQKQKIEQMLGLKIVAEEAD